MDLVTPLLDAYPIFTLEIAGNSLWQYIWVFLIFWVYLFAFRLGQMLLLHRLRYMAQKTQTEIDDTLIEIISTLKPPFYLFLAFYFASRILELSTYVGHVLDAVLIAWAIFQVIQVVQILINYVAKRYIAKEDKGEAESAIQALNIIAKITIWSFGILLLLSNIGVDVTSLVAGLGIGGLAIAFAVQGILSDLFSSFTLYFDKPFKVGDFIVVGDKAGVVEKIGIKTSRIRALQGEEVVIPNQDLTASHIQNFKQMSKRRVAFEIGVVYDTSPQKLKTIPSMIQKIIEHHEQVSFDRAHFKTFGDYALIFEIVYHVLDRDFNLYMDIHQEINLEILAQFHKHNINIAFPTQTIRVKKLA